MYIGWRHMMINDCHMFVICEIMGLASTTNPYIYNMSNRFSLFGVLRAAAMCPTMLCFFAQGLWTYTIYR